MRRCGERGRSDEMHLAHEIVERLTPAQRTLQARAEHGQRTLRGAVVVASRGDRQQAERR